MLTHKMWPIILYMEGLRMSVNFKGELTGTLNQTTCRCLLLFAYVKISEARLYTVTYLSSFIAICSGSVSPSNSTMTGAHILQEQHKSIHYTGIGHNLFVQPAASSLIACPGRIQRQVERNTYHCCAT